MFRKFRVAIISLIVAVMLLPSWLISSAVSAPSAYASTTSGGGGCSSVVNGTGQSFTLDPFLLVVGNLGDINAAKGIKVRLSTATSAQTKSLKILQLKMMNKIIC